MKTLFTGLLLLGSVTTFASVIGNVEVKNYASIENTSFMTISGDAAKKIWDDMVQVSVSPANQFQPNDMKIGDGINCEKIKKTQEVYCHIILNSSEGIIKH